jgi:phosphate transport system permease protein
MKLTTQTKEKLVKLMLWLVFLLIIFVLSSILYNIVVNGLSALSWEFLTQNPRNGGKEGGIFSTFVSTLYLTGIAVVFAVPVGVSAAIFLAEYVRDGWAVRVIRFGVEALAGIPSIVFGLFGFAFFVIYLKWGWSILSGGVTLALMILPVIIRTAEESLYGVPNSYREGSLALGATKWQTIWKVVLPSAVPGIFSGIILGIGRAIGETAAVLLTAGSALGIPLSLWDTARTMPVHLYILANEGVSLERAYGTALMLILVVVMINYLANYAANRLRVNR